MTDRIVIPWNDPVTGEQVLVSKNDKMTKWSNGRMALTDGYRDAKGNIRDMARKQWEGDPYDWPIALVMTYFEPTRHRRDIANYNECLFDGLENIAFTDDYWVFCLSAQRGGKDAENPRVEIDVIDLDTYTVDLHIREEDTDIGFE